MKKSFLLLAFLLICISVQLANVRADDYEKPDDDKKSPAPAPAPEQEKSSDADATNYDELTPDPETGRQRAYCKSNGKCNKKTLTCPAECPERKPKKNKKQKGCFIQCGSKCEATCKCKQSVGRTFFFYLTSMKSLLLTDLYIL